MPLPLALTQVCYVPLHTPASIYNACALKVNDNNVIIASGKQGRLSMVALVDRCPVERQFDTRKERKTKIHSKPLTNVTTDPTVAKRRVSFSPAPEDGRGVDHRLTSAHRCRIKATEVSTATDEGTADPSVLPQLSSPVIPGVSTGLGDTTGAGAVPAKNSETDNAANDERPATHTPRISSNDTAADTATSTPLPASPLVQGVVQPDRTQDTTTPTTTATATATGARKPATTEPLPTATGTEDEDSEDDTDDITAVVSVVAYTEKTADSSTLKDDDSKIVVAVTLVIPDQHLSPPVSGSASSATGNAPPQSMSANVSTSNITHAKSAASVENVSPAKTGGLMYPVGNPHMAQYASMSSQPQLTPTINLLPTQAQNDKPSPNTFVLRIFVAPLNGTTAKIPAETLEENNPSQAKQCLDWLDNLAEVQEIVLNYKPFYMFHTTAVDGRRLLLLCGSDHRVHLYGRPTVCEDDEFVELMEPHLYPEFAALRSTALSCEMRYLPQTTQRITVVGCRSGYLKLSVLNYATNVIELEEHVYFDGPVTAVELFTDKPNDSEGSPVHLLVTCAVEAAFVYRDVVMYGLENGTHLPGSSDADTVNCLLVRDVSFRQTNSILLGTFGNKLLRYILDKESDSQEYILSEVYDLGQPVFLLLSSDVTKDGVDELVILLRDGILVSKVGLNEAQERCSTILDNLSKAIQRLRDRKRIT